MDAGEPAEDRSDLGVETACVSFDDVVRSSGYRNVVTTNSPPMIYLHDGTADRSVTTTGIAAYWLAESGLSTPSNERAHQILEKLEHLGDWAAGEIMGRRRRDQERAESGYHDAVPRLTGPQMLVRRFVRRNPGASPEQVAAGIEMPSVTVNEVVSELRLAGILQGGRSADGLFLTESEQRRYEMLD